MESEFLIKFATPLTGLAVSVLGSIVALLTFWQKQKSHRIELAEKLHLALKDDSKLLAMEAFSQLTGLRYRYSDIKLITEENDALQRLIMLKKRSDAVTFSNGEYSYVKTYNGASKSPNYYGNWFFFVVGMVLVVISIVMLFAASIIGKFTFIFVVLLAASILLVVYSATEIYWYREADRVLKKESEKRLEIKQAKR